MASPKLPQQTTKKIKLILERMKASLSKQKSYVDRRRKPLEFDIGHHVFLRVTPTGIGKAIKKKKLSPKFMESY